MQLNVGGIDRTLRIVVGVAAIGAGVYFQSWWGALGAIPLGTALVGYCPAWTLIGVNTRKDAA